MDEQKIDFEYDVSDEVWNVYKKVYTKEKWDFWGKVDLYHPKYAKKRRYAYIDTTINDYIEFNEHRTFSMSGETDFNFHEEIDLLVIGFEEYPCLKDKELEEFICKLSREYIRIVALFNLFCLKNKQMDLIIELCQKQDLPLMRETYSCKKGLLSKCVLSDDIISDGRT